jgi:hypothetical protein
MPANRLQGCRRSDALLRHNTRFSRRVFLFVFRPVRSFASFAYFRL